MDSRGPTLANGGPGTGKSTVALYRVKEMVKSLKAAGTPTPRILFTTYTNALVTFSRQLLEQLLGADAHNVEVRTADSVVVGNARRRLDEITTADPQELRDAIRKAIETARFEGNALEQRAGSQAVHDVDPDNLIEEITGVIQARELKSIDEYLAAARPGRRVAFNATRRKAIWAIKEAFEQALAGARRHTWQQVRSIAADSVRAGEGPGSYDGVVIDEAQDLDPSVVRLLVSLCRTPNRLFLTADANQSIYGSGFRWIDVHESLRFRGRTALLQVNHRSTREIGEAGRSYLREGALDPDEEPTRYANEGPMPAVRFVKTEAEDVDLLTWFLPGAARQFRLGVRSAAVFVPTEKAGRRIADGLKARGLAAEFMSGKNLDLARDEIKVLTLKSSKGLEFPTVALAGFLDGPYPMLKPGIQDQERAEVLLRERRTVYVGMTRAMRALLVLLAERNRSPLLYGFDSALWNLEP